MSLIAKVFNFIEAQFINTSLHGSCLLYLESYHQSHLNFLLSYKSFIVYILHLHLFYFELIFVVGLRSVSGLIVFACVCPVVPAPFVEKDCLCYIVSPLFLCQRSTDYIYVGLFLDPLFCSIHLFVLLFHQYQLS